MLRPRLQSLPSQFLVSTSLNAHQVRYKTAKRLYKGDIPRKPKPPQKPSVQPPNNEIKDERKLAPVKKQPRDPLQGMREAHEEAKIIKYPDVVAKAARASSALSTTGNENSEISGESEKHVSAAEDLTSPSGRPIPPPPNRIPPASNFDGDRKWMFYAMAAIFAAGGAYLFWYGDSKPTVAPAIIKPSTVNVNTAIKKLKQIFRERCCTEEDELEEYGGGGIMSVGPGQRPRAVVFPTTTEEVEVILKIADDYSVPVIPYSGGTSVEGQCVPVVPSITISLQKMNKIIALRPHDMDVTLQPGISWNDLNDYLKPYNLFLPVDPGPHAHIGGMIATSCSGTNAVRYGTMKDWVLNLTVVLPGGHVMKTRSRARKNSTGYDLTRLFCGSEGTLGIITEVTLKLAHLPEKEVVGAIAFESNEAAAKAVSKLMERGVEPRCVELLDSTCVSAMNNSLGSDIAPFPVKPHLFFKLAGSADAVPKQQKLLTSVLKGSGGSHLRIARSEKEGEKLWDVRKSLILSLVAMYPGSDIIATDVCVPLSQLSRLIEQYKVDQERINSTINGEAKLTSLIMGHVGDGNFHSMIAFEKGNEELKRQAKELEDTVVTNALALDGTCSGEHGVGIHKIDFMRSEYDETALTLMRAIKAGVDPKGIMNPYTLLPQAHGFILPPRTATIELENIAGSVVKGEILSAPAGTDPNPKFPEKQGSGDSFFSMIAGKVGGLFGTRTAVESKNEKALKGDQETVKEPELLPK